LSTIAYARLTRRREEAKPPTMETNERAANGQNQTTSDSVTGLGTYVDAVAALVPAEVLGLHAAIISFTTKTEPGTLVTEITAPRALSFAFWGLIVLSVLLYVFGHIGSSRKWDRLDWLRLLIPPIAFVCWTLLQKTTAFDAQFSQFQGPGRFILGLFVAVVLGLCASILATKANEEKPS
jgi:hypothetical protein